jgi:hypothetical protein
VPVTHCSLLTTRVQSASHTCVPSERVAMW